MLTRAVSVVVLYALCAAVMVHAQLPTPGHPDDSGHTKGPPLAPVQVDAFVDLLCPFSAAQYKTFVNDVLPLYSESVRFVVHIFPLPYHHNSFYLTQGAIAAESLDEDLFWEFVDAVFANQTAFGQDVTQALSGQETIDLAYATVTGAGVSLDKAGWYAAMGNDDLTEKSVVSWKYGTTRGVYGTPTFLLNGIMVLSDTSSVAAWQALLDPLVPSHTH